MEITMYTVIGIKPGGEQSKPLSYATLAAALKKLQDLIEADELEVETGQSAMFSRYTVIPNLPPSAFDDGDQPQMPGFVPPPGLPPPGGWSGPDRPPLRLVQ
jgi:hypothetical protein